MKQDLDKLVKKLKKLSGDTNQVANGLEEVQGVLGYSDPASAHVIAARRGIKEAYVCIWRAFDELKGEAGKIES